MTGAKTYGEVGKAAFGKNMEYFISCLLCVHLTFAIVAYMILAKDIWTSVVKLVGHMEASPNDELVLGAIIMLIVPLLVQKSLHALRFSCYVGVFSVTTLCLALVRLALAVPAWSNVMWWSTNMDDVLVAFPIITLSFCGIFNVLPIQNALVMPSRARMLQVLDGSVSAVVVISLIFGLAGYLFAGVKTDGNILKNCEATGGLNLLLGKLGCGIMVVMAIPMMMVPCRSSLLELTDVLFNGTRVTPVEVDESEKLPLITSDGETSGRTYDSTITPSNQRAEDEIKRMSPNRRLKVNILDNCFIHYASTFLIFATCFMVAVRVPGVAVVWSILGCSTGYSLVFILPCVCYLKIQKQYPAHASKHDSWVWFSWILSVTSIVAMVVCTVETVKAIPQI